MKLSQFIKDLKKVQKEKGDLDVYTNCVEYSEDSTLEGIAPSGEDSPGVCDPVLKLDHIFNDNFVKSRKKHLIIDASVKWS